MSAKFDKGHRVGIVSGRSGKGMRGEVFWIGESRYGKGARYGVRGDDGETYWVDEQHLGAETDVPEPEAHEPARAPPRQGARVRITRGEGAGHTGEVFWIGDRKFGRGTRYGVRADDGGESFWVDDVGCEPIEGRGAGSRPGSSPGLRPARRGVSRRRRRAPAERRGRALRGRRRLRGRAPVLTRAR
ncbi:MAG: hypothetical protein M5U28_53210 [Sandaracinaceae bacterium]|nr:hypothetical protein [Sandaracinaceae bacterium]